MWGQSQSASNFVYLDEATTSWPKAPGVLDAVTSALTLPPLAFDGDEPGHNELIWECRERLARLLNVPAAESILLTSGATHALNLALFGLGRHRGWRVVASCADHESVLRPLRHLRGTRRAHLIIVGLDATGDIDRESFASALERGTSLVVLPHASHVTGRVFDVAPLFRLARSAGAQTLLNASQTVGEIPVHPEELGAHMVALTGHKRLRGPSGTGALYVAPHVLLCRLFMGGARVCSGVVTEMPDLPAGFETGRPDIPAFAGLRAALRWHEESGAVCQREGRRLGQLLRKGLRRIGGLRVLSDARRAPRVPIVSLLVTGQRVADVKANLEERFGIRCSSGLHCAPLIHKAIGSKPDGTVRLSLSGFNTEGQVRYALRALRRIASESAGPRSYTLHGPLVEQHRARRGA